MEVKRFLWSVALALLTPAAAMAYAPQLGYSSAQIYQANSTVQLLSISPGSGLLQGLMCNFPGGADGASVRIEIDTDVGTPEETDQSFVVDPTYFQQESNGAGQFLSGWVLLGVQMFDSALVKLNNTGLSTATINCWITWTSTDIE